MRLPSHKTGRVLEGLRIAFPSYCGGTLSGHPWGNGSDEIEVPTLNVNKQTSKQEFVLASSLLSINVSSLVTSWKRGCVLTGYLLLA